MSEELADRKAARRWGNRILAGVLIGAYGLLFLSWALSNPPVVPADETAHYLRAAGVVRGQWILPKPPPLPREAERKLPANQRRALSQTRIVKLPASMSPESLECRRAPFAVWCPVLPTPTSDTPIEMTTNMGTSQPFSYVIPGAGTLLSERVIPSIFLGRMVMALASTLAVAAGVLALWQAGRGALSTIGLMVAMTPMLISVGGSLTSSGPEVLGAVCFFACLLRIARAEAPSRWIWPATAASGFFLAVTRDLGPFWLGMQLLIFLGMVGIGPALARFKASGKPALSTSAVIAAGLALNAFWQIRYEPHPPLGFGVLSKHYDPGWAGLRDVGKHAIGVFGPLDTVLSPGIYFGWTSLLIALMTIAFLVGTRRHRSMIVTAVGLSLMSILALETIQRSVGFAVQGRHLLPILVTIPMLSGEVIHLNRSNLANFRPRPVRWFAVGVAVLQATAWHIVGRRYAVGPVGDNLFYREPYYAPPLGWLLWGSAVLAACLAIAAFGLVVRNDWDGVAGNGREGSSARSGLPT